MAAEIFIVGAGAAFPETELSTDFVLSLSEDMPDLQEKVQGLGINTRFSSLPEDYLRETKNRDPFEGRKVALCSPSDLGFEAAQQALERAGVKPEELGLIVGATATPYQTTPSEAQRIGEKFGLKVPAYDVYCGAADLALQLRTLSSWKADRVPEYVLCVSTNTPTQRVNYERAMEGALFGDGATALLVSNSHHHGFRLEDSAVKVSYASEGLGEVDIFDSLALSQYFLQGSEAQIENLLSRMKDDSDLKGLTLILGQLPPASEKRILSQYGKEFSHLLSSTDRQGIHLGSSGYSLLSEYWTKFSAGEKVWIGSCGIGDCAGYVQLTALGSRTGS